MSTGPQNFHVPLPPDLYSGLRLEAKRSGKPATAVAREAIRHWLEARRQAGLHRAIVSYAERHAGTRTDLDEALEAAAVEVLREEEESDR
ncbi:MAG: hypothetical protein HY905_13850 [Deltaproteobacteria bacterium]|nr:hypothetical protein [Deltaproteobacteria bacterium]